MVSMRVLFLALALALGAATAHAAVIYWQGDSPVSVTDWNRPENWDLNRVPTTGDHVLIHRVAGQSIGMPIVRTKLGGFSYVTPSWHAVDSSIEITTGGRIDTYSFFLGYGAGAGSMGRLIMNGGELYTRWLQVGNSGNGTIQLNAGTIRVALDVSFGQELGGGTGRIDVRGGRLIFAGDCLAKLQNAISQGWITAYGGAGRPIADFDASIAGHTVLWAVTSSAHAWGPTPAPQGSVAADQSTPVALAWQAGNLAVKHDLYVGESPAAVASATRAQLSIYRGELSQPTATVDRLTPGTTYYWRVDEINAQGAVTKGDVWSFSIAAPAIGDLMTDTWVATDGIGRSLPGRAECGAPRADRTTAIYYVQWFGYHGTGGPYNATQTIAANPASPNWINDAYWWDEPEMGYFLSDDRWMIRRDIAMLTAAGIDVVIFEATNGFPYTGAAVSFLEELEKMEQQGYHTPLKFCFWTNAGSPPVVTTYYNALYAKGVFQDRWFYWKGKPLMLGYPDGLATDNPRTSVSQEIRDFFNWRSAWAWDAGQYKWQFVDTSPQDYGWAEASDRPEQVVVSPASHPTSNLGKSYLAGVQPALNQYDVPVAGTEGQGLQFAEQSVRARLLDPELLWLTEWNEWIAGCYTRDENTGPINFLGEAVPIGGKFFVDQYNREFNRDLAPMKGGYTDNYYYQMIDTIRRYEGVRTLPPAGGAAPITIDGNFSEWCDVTPVFRDLPGDTAPRYHLGWGMAGMLTTDTARNDIVEARVARDASHLHFYARTRAPLTGAGSANWMLLFIDSDQSRASGWQGYDYVVNLGGCGTTTTLRRSGSTWGWNLINDDLPIRYAGNEIELSIPRSALQQGDGDAPVALDFHWADNIPAAGNIAEFFTQGDSAPDRRFNYRYQTSAQVVTPLIDEDWEGSSTPWGDWDLSTAAAYSDTHSLECTRDDNAGTLVGLNTAGYQSFRLSFRYKLVNVWNAYPVTMWYHDGTQWTQIANLSTSPPNVWLHHVDVRFNSGDDARYFTPNLAFHLQGESLTGVTQAVYIDDIKMEAIGEPAGATQPFPPNAATGVPLDVMLGWTAAEAATGHRVHFGTSSPGAFQSQLSDVEQFVPATALLPSTTYYWHVDEVTPSGTVSGPTWSFTTAPAAVPGSPAGREWQLYEKP